MIKLENNAEKFEFVGNRETSIRTEDELALVDKKAADAAFRKYKKEIMDKLMSDNGFHKYKTSDYVRLNPIGLLELINLQKCAYGSKTFCVNFAAMPLYCENEFIDLSFGSRLGRYIAGRNVWWDYANDETARKSFANVALAVEKYVFPWFEKISTEEGYRAELPKCPIDKSKEDFFEALDNVKDKEAMIDKAIIQFKLPEQIKERQRN